VQAVTVPADPGIDLAVGSLQPRRRHQCGSAMAWTSEIDGLLAGQTDQPRHVRVDERKARTGAPMAEKSWLDVVDTQRSSQQGVVLQIDLSDGQVVAGPPPGIKRRQLLVGQRAKVTVGEVNSHSTILVGLGRSGEKVPAIWAQTASGPSRSAPSPPGIARRIQLVVATP
jgi:hypothetical protein